MLIPEALNAVISLSDDNLPKAIKVAIRIDMGIASDIIQAELYTKNFNTVPRDNPLPKNLSIFFNMKFDNKTNINMNRELTNGIVNSFIIYLFIILFIGLCIKYKNEIILIIIYNSIKNVIYFTSVFFDNFSRCSAVRLAHLLWEQGVAGSNPATSTQN